jgi:hypothetical protein
MSIYTIKEQINHIANELKETYGDYYAEQYYNSSINLLENLSNKLTEYQIILETMQTIMDDDYKLKLIQNLQKRLKEQDIRINKLENENTELKSEIVDLKTNINKLNKRLDDKEEREYIITLIQATRNMEHYIIKKLTNWSDDEIRNYGGLNKFKKNNQNFMSEIQDMEDEFGLTVNKQNIIKINEKRKIYAHPNPIDIEELEKACDKFCGKYNGLTELYKGYKKYCEYTFVEDE